MSDAPHTTRVRAPTKTIEEQQRRGVNALHTNSQIFVATTTIALIKLRALCINATDFFNPI